MQLKAGDYLFMEGSFDDHLYIVKKGFLRQNVENTDDSSPMDF